MDFRFILIPIVAFLPGLAAVMVTRQAWQEQARIYAARGWPVSHGRIIASGIKETAVRVRRGTSLNRYRQAVRYQPHIIYEYEVGGVRHQGERVHLGSVMLASDAKEAALAASRYPVGSQVAVAYDPADPTAATLELSTGWGTRIKWLAAFVLWLTAFALVVFFLGSPSIGM